MKLETEHYPPSQIEAFLDGQLSASEEQRLASHLDVCEVCRQRLDDAAATVESWGHASTFLKDDPLDLAPLVDSSDELYATTQPQIKQVLDVLAPSDEPHMLGRLGHYEVIGVIGAGGMGVVLKAYDRPLDRTVAIKIMAPHLALSGAARQRFSREARAAAAVLHPNVIAIFGVTTDAVLPYLVMPYVGGASLQKRLDDSGPLPVEDVVRIGLQIASGLAAAHDLGLVHRDIKPANILLDQGVERLVITDFGLARTVDEASVTRTGVIAGTPQFMSPEQARGDAIDARSDLFSLGSVLYTACTGRVPFRAESPYGVLRRITDDQPRAIREINPQIPEWLCSLILRLHAKRPEDRFQSADEVALLLTDCLAHLNQPTLHPLPKELRVAARTPRLSLMLRPSVAAVSLCLLVATILFYGLTNWWRPATQPPTPPPTASAGASVSPSIDESNEQLHNLSANESTDGGVAGPDTNPASSSAGTTAASTERDASASDASTMPVVLPWDDPQALKNWNDQLTPLLESIEQTLETQLEQ